MIMFVDVHDDGLRTVSTCCDISCTAAWKSGGDSEGLATCVSIGEICIRDHQFGSVISRYTDELPVIISFSDSQRRCTKADRCLCNQTKVKDI